MGDGQLGTDNDVEALVRRALRESWCVEVDGGSHSRWISPDRREFRSPLTGGRGHRQRVERRLAAMDPKQFGDLAPAVARRHEAAAVASILVVVPVELEVAAAELSALAELLDELVVGTGATVEDLDHRVDPRGSLAASRGRGSHHRRRARRPIGLQVRVSPIAVTPFPYRDGVDRPAGTR